jgi:hypothetical protein
MVGGHERFWPCLELIVPILEPRGLPDLKSQIRPARELDCAPDNLGQLAAILVRIHSRSDFRSGRHPGSRGLDQFRLDRIRLSANRGIPVAVA